MGGNTAVERDLWVIRQHFAMTSGIGDGLTTLLCVVILVYEARMNAEDVGDLQ